MAGSVSLALLFGARPCGSHILRAIARRCVSPYRSYALSLEDVFRPTDLTRYRSKMCFALPILRAVARRCVSALSILRAVAQELRQCQLENGIYNPICDLRFRLSDGIRTEPSVRTQV
jgi:hypothetical protein